MPSGEYTAPSFQASIQIRAAGREPVRPRAGRLASFIQEVEPVLGDEGRTAYQTHPTRLDALICASHIDGLGRGSACDDGGQHTNNQ